MGKLRLAFLSFLKDISVYIIIIIEISAVFFVMNMVVAGIENQKMLLRPYEKILRKPGVEFFRDNDPTRAETMQMDLNDFIRACDNVIEEIKETAADTFNLFTIYAEYGGKNIDVIIYDDSIVPFSLPLKKGKWAKGSMSGVISPNTLGLGVGSTVTINGLEIKISGMLTDPSYRPAFDEFSYILDVSMHYRTYRGMDKEENPFILLPLSSIPEEIRDSYIKTGNSGFIWFFSYAEDSDEVMRKEIEAKLAEFGEVMSFSEIYDNSIAKIKDMLEKFVPLYVSALIIILIGFISNKAIRMQNSKNDIMVYSLCGADDKDLFKIFILQDVILLSVSVLLSVFALLLCDKMGIATDLGMHLSVYNLAATLIGVLGFMAVSLVINFFFRRVSYD